MDIDGSVTQRDDESTFEAVARWRQTRAALDRLIREKTEFALREARTGGITPTEIAHRWRMTEGRVYQLLRQHDID
ncbi:hypothetical protein [Saccharopolyspora taberi]|uniref:Uncharacterized protein n=1 Tax=Saccharopolyspora taberi TaxID=60895 RepID=A0ABN3VGH6_9PSEU